MKKFILSAVLSVFIAASSFAADANKVNSKAAIAFKEEFTAAQNVQWTSTEDYVRASFTLDNKNMEAFYDKQGNMIGTSSTISISDLPTNAKRSFAKKYADFTVKEAIQFIGNDETSYYVSAENEAQSVVLKISVEGFISVFKSVRK